MILPGLDRQLGPRGHRVMHVAYFDDVSWTDSQETKIPETLLLSLYQLLDSLQAMVSKR